VSRPSARTPAPPADGQVCALFAVDIAGFTGPHRDDDIRLYLHEELYQVLHKAFDASGIPWADCFCEDRGDGALIVVPPVVPCKGLIDPLPERLRGLIRRHNHVSRDSAGIQLRAAAHIGRSSTTGTASSAPISTCCSACSMRGPSGRRWLGPAPSWG
jgi:hypothetical protein